MYIYMYRSKTRQHTEQTPHINTSEISRNKSETRRTNTSKQRVDNNARDVCKQAGHNNECTTRQVQEKKMRGRKRRSKRTTR